MPDGLYSPECVEWEFSEGELRVDGVLGSSDVRCSEDTSVLAYLSQNDSPLFSAAKPMFVDQLLRQPRVLGKLEVGSRIQLPASRQVLLGYQLYSRCLDGMIHAFLRSLWVGALRQAGPSVRSLLL